MASVEKLAIRGIRSFSPDCEQSIEFYSPLTMIVGANGCGKTTIIEALKYATTGIPPPGSGGGKAFVHDPKVSGLTEVKANIKLRFRNYAGQAMVVVRSMSVTQKKSTSTFKQMEGVIRATDAKTGEKTSFTHKCADLNTTVPTLIGVSKAVLESVIFCHQEESSWPLQEGAVLKKKFDDIFESSRYSKALDSLAKQRKEKQAKVKELVGDLKGLLADRTASKTYRKRLADAETTVSECSEQMGCCDDRTAQLDGELEQLRVELLEVERREREVARVAGECRLIEGSLKTMLENMGSEGAMEQPDAALTLLSERLQRESDQAEVAMSALRTERGLRCEEATRFRDTLSTLATELGSQQTQRSFFKANVAKLTQAVDELKRSEQAASAELRAKLRACPQQGPYSRDTARQLAHALQQQSANCAEAERASQREADEQVASTSAAARFAKTELEGHEQRKVELGAQRDAASASCAAAAAEEQKLRVTDEQLAKADDKLQRSQRCVDALAGTTANFEELERHISDAERAELELSRQISSENDVLRSLQQSEDEQNELRVLESKRDEATWRFKAAYEQRASVLAEACEQYDAREGGSGAVFGDAPDARERQNAVEEFVAKISTALRAARDRARKTETEQRDVDATQRGEVRSRTVDSDKAKSARCAADAQLAGMRSPRLRLAAMHDQCSDVLCSIQEDEVDEERRATFAPDAAALRAMSDVDFLERHVARPARDGVPDARQELLAWARKQLDTVRTSAMAGTTYSEIAGKLEAMFTKSQARGCAKCPLCKRDFQDDQDALTAMHALLDKLKGNVANQAETAQTQLKLEQLTADLTGNLECEWGAWARAMGAARSCAELQAAAETAREEAEEQADHAAVALESARELCEHACEHLGQCEEMEEFCREAAEYRAAFDEQRDKIESWSNSRGGGTARRSPREVLDRVQQLQDEKNEAVNKKAAAEKEKNRALTEEANTRQKHADLAAEATRLRTEFEAKQRKEAVRKEARALEKRLTDEIKDLRARGKQLENDQRLARQHHEAITCDWAGRKEDARKIATDAARCAEQFERHRTQAEEGERRMVEADEQLASLELRRDEGRVREKDAEAAAAQLSKEISEKSSGKSQSLLLKRRVTDNLQYRQSQLELEAKEADKAELATAMRSVGASAGAVATRKEAVNRKLAQIAAERGMLIGRKNTSQEHARENKRELESARYKGVDERHRTALIEKETTDYAAKDLELFWGSLDRALLNYHSIKIAEINRIVRELWTITYMGEDIDQIEIVSGEEAGSNKASRSYNYHVQMRKGDAALDMKGRCSAGQRVLASIVIRLALAETFGIKCGILALDEPTTNLDEPNRRSLASGLSRIIGERSRQQNFQLVVITHDEEFIATMRNELASQAGFSMPEFYFKISREEQGGRHYSKIDKCPIENLGS